MLIFMNYFRRCKSKKEYTYHKNFRGQFFVHNFLIKASYDFLTSALCIEQG